jgi:MFS transporter, UMF1 family
MPARDMTADRSSLPTTPATRREIFAWAMYDFANSGYTTLVLTAIFNAYFVGVVIERDADSNGTAALLWTAATGIANLLVLVSAPVIGAIADHGARKKQFLLITTAGCTLFTALLATVGPGQVGLGMVLLVISAVLFHTGEDLIAAFLPEIASERDMGRISGYGWSLGYLGGMLALGVCLAYIALAEVRGESAADYVPATMLITAAIYALASVPTFLWLRERALPQPLRSVREALTVAVARLGETLHNAHRYRDLFRFLMSLAVYHCGIYTVIVLAAIYAQDVMGFSGRDTVVLILVVNATAALGAFGFGLLQDRFGSVPTLAVTLLLWIAALTLAYGAHSSAVFWVVANVIGVALGSSQSAGRALIGLLSPPGRSAEFFGLWGLVGKLAAVVGPLSYGSITYFSRGNERLALLCTTLYFIVGLLLLLTVDEKRGRCAASRYRAGA